MSQPNLKHIHFIGIGGSGMSVLAEYALKAGIIVTGSDQVASKVTDHLSSMGADIGIGHYMDPIRNGSPLVVYSTAIDENDDELCFAKAESREVIHRSDLLYKFMDGRKSITIAGTHGKTTTSALLYHMLEKLGVSPHGIIGGRLADSGEGGFIGQSDYFVAEVDESDGSFLNAKPSVAILTNIEADHLDYYGDEPALYKAFNSYLSSTDTENGINIIGWDLDSTRSQTEDFFDTRITYGLSIGSDVRAFHVSPEQGYTSFKAVIGKETCEVKLPLLGEHNVKNALACLAVASFLELDIDEASRALESFPGVRRRLEFCYKSEKIVIVDDYAHNPGKMKACVSSIRKSYPTHKIVVFYEPHRYSRLETMYEATIRCFEGADYVYVLPVYSAGEKPKKVWDMSQVAFDISKNSCLEASFIGQENLPYSSLLEKIEVPTILLTLGAGSVTRISSRFKDILTDGKQEST